MGVLALKAGAALGVGILGVVISGLVILEKQTELNDAV
jgi:hypothetical protein